MPYYRHVHSADVVHTKKDSARDKELAADPQWARTPDKDSDDVDPSDDLNANPAATA